MEGTRWPICVQGNSNLSMEKLPEGVQPLQDPAFIPAFLIFLFVSPSHTPIVVACNDQERLSRAGMLKFDHWTESHCCKNHPSSLVDLSGFSGEAGNVNHCRISLVWTKGVSQLSLRSAQLKQEGGAAPCCCGDSCDLGDLHYVENPPQSSLSDSLSWWEMVGLRMDEATTCRKNQLRCIHTGCHVGRA